MTIKRLLINASLSLLVTMSQFVSASDRSSQEYLSVKDLQNIKISDLKSKQYSKFSDDLNPFETDHRTEAVREAAMVVGSQHGYISRMSKWKSMLKSMENEMDALWDFATLMRLANGNQNGRFLIPPIIQEVNNVRTLSGDARVINIKGTHLKIVRAERLSLQPINWRSYLLYDDPVNAALPPSELFPDEETPIEQDVWNEAVNDGWVRGAEHAEKEMAYRLMRMGQDFNGIAVYVRLAMIGKIKETIVSYSKEDVVGGGNELIENQEVYRIAVPAQFNGNPNNWKPFILSTRDSLTFPLEEGSSTDPLKRK